jgi:hypothetical protein
LAPLALRSCILIAAFFLPMFYAQRTTVSAEVTGGDQKVMRYQATVEAIQILWS